MTWFKEGPTKSLEQWLKDGQGGRKGSPTEPVPNMLMQAPHLSVHCPEPHAVSELIHCFQQALWSTLAGLSQRKVLIPCPATPGAFTHAPPQHSRSSALVHGSGCSADCALLSLPVCGQPVTPIAQNPRILGSSRAQLGNFPWQAFTSIYGRGGGALLGDRWVLTAAHTIQPKDSVGLRKNRSVDVFLGHTDVAEMLKAGNHPVRRVFVHPDYRQNESHDFSGDIALLELRHSVPLSPNLLPVCLPDSESLYLAGSWGYVSGFGVEMGWLTEELKYSRLPVAPREACEAWLRERHRAEVFSDSMFCVGDKRQTDSVCQGDSGSVYVVWDDHTHRWVATGIVSWGIGCGKGYGFYTKVLNYVDWIKGVMDSKD